MAIKHTVRSHKQDAPPVELKLTRRTAMMRFCYECMGFDHNEVKACSAPLCPLHPFRTGRPLTRRGPKKRSGTKKQG